MKNDITNIHVYVSCFHMRQAQRRVDSTDRYRSRQKQCLKHEELIAASIPKLLFFAEHKGMIVAPLVYKLLFPTAHHMRQISP
jgi:hypothetical protein